MRDEDSREAEQQNKINDLSVFRFIRTGIYDDVPRDASL